MSDEPRWTLGQYITALVSGVSEAEPASAARLREVVGTRTARIAVDGEQVFVRFEGMRLSIVADAPSPDGEGTTDRQTVLDLLDGRLEATDAVLSDRLQLAGSTDSVVRISQAIEILIDVVVREPGLQGLADRYRAETTPVAWIGRVAIADDTAELALLRRLGLLPE
jgi:SCP-2 sterol transfer family